MNIQLIDSLVQVIRALSLEERAALTEQLFFDHTYPTTQEITALASKGNSFDFLAQEPDLYNCEDGKSLLSSSWININSPISPNHHGHQQSRTSW